MKEFIKAAKKEINLFVKDLKNAIQDLKSIKTIYKQIPNIFTFSRLLLVPFIFSNIIAGNLMTAGALTISAALTDCIDGALARKLNVSSELGRKLDAIIDKIFVVTVAIPMTIIQPFLILPITLDLIIANINGYAHLKGYNPHTSRNGKIKTVFLDALVSAAFFANVSFIKPLIPILYATTLGLQYITGKEYYKLIQEKKTEKKVQEQLKYDENNNEESEPIETTQKKMESNKLSNQKEVLEYYKEQCLKIKEEEQAKKMVFKKK